MKRWTYRDGWKMANVEVDADEVTFEPAHVAFWLLDAPGKSPTLVLAVDNRNVSALRQLTLDEEANR